jgi:hypothetical protein
MITTSYSCRTYCKCACCIRGACLALICMTLRVSGGTEAEVDLTPGSKGHGW